MYHLDEGHGGAEWIGNRLLDPELVPIAREAFLAADDMPPDDEILRVLGDCEMHLIGEGYHVVTLADPAKRFVVKYAKHEGAIPPLAPPRDQPRREEWAHDHGVQPEGGLHPAIWQHIRSFEAYGELAVPNRAYIAESAYGLLSDAQRRMLERFRSIGIVRWLGRTPRKLHIRYPDDFPDEKRAPDGVVVSVLVVQRHVTPVVSAIERELRSGNPDGARHLNALYTRFVQDLWRFGISHLDFSMLNVGVTGSGVASRLALFDPHMGVIEVSGGGREVHDPMVPEPEQRSLNDLLRGARDGSRWAMWRAQQAASAEGPREHAAAAAEVVREFHVATSEGDQEDGAFSLRRFDRTWGQRGAHGINAVLHAQLWKLLRHPLSGLLYSVLAAPPHDEIYDRTLRVQGIWDERPLPQFRAGLAVYERRPLIVIANIADDAPRLVKHWGRLRLPPEVDVQADPAIHYHLTDLFTGETYIRSGEDLARGFVCGLPPYGLHVLQIEDVVVEDLAVERALAANRDVSGFLKDCTKRVGVVGDVHGELQALKEILRALGFIDASDHWSAGDGTLVFTGDVGHGAHLQAVFDFIHELAGQAHRRGGRIVWTLGNHDLYVDREGGQGGQESLGYRLWPSIREAALHPERHPGLLVKAAYFDHGKLFVHGGILPNIVEIAMHEQGASGASEVASYVNEVFRRALLARERITTRDLPHEIFRTGTSHARERRLPGEVGYEPAGVFTPDLREVDHYRYHDRIFPQIIGHTASKNGEIRYSPSSWLRRDYIAIDVGRQHGAGNGGLLLTDFGWVAVTPGGRARLVEVGSLFVKLAHDAAAAVEETWSDSRRDAHLREMLAYFRAAKSESRSLSGRREALLLDLSPAQVTVLERFLVTTRQTGRCVIVTDPDHTLAVFFAEDLERSTIDVLANYLAAGGVLIVDTGAPFDSFYYRFLRRLIVELGPRSRFLTNVPLILSGGTEIYMFEDGAYRLVCRSAGKRKSEGFDTLVKLSSERRLHHVLELDPENVVYVGDSSGPERIDRELAARVGIAIDVGDAMLDMPGQFINLRHGYVRTLDLIATATAALEESGRAELPEPAPEVDDTVLWTFAAKRFPPGRRLRVRVGASGYVHAGVAHADGSWDPIYNVPLTPRHEGGYDAVLPSGVNAFTFFWTEAPQIPDHPGHWERCVFAAETSSSGG